MVMTHEQYMDSLDDAARRARNAEAEAVADDARWYSSMRALNASRGAAQKELDERVGLINSAGYFQRGNPGSVL
ncbi:hypothetical protein [Nakamurella lactea]|uniref:hypothetical protein n=1 Tax=Nakamurella lactea TaxID=459515 RepID=UPI000414258A|nr:hypothetical protein [Nakamurella lactea]